MRLCICQLPYVDIYHFVTYHTWIYTDMLTYSKMSTAICTYQIPYLDIHQYVNCHTHISTTIC